MLISDANRYAYIRCEQRIFWTKTKGRDHARTYQPSGNLPHSAIGPKHKRRAVVSPFTKKCTIKCTIKIWLTTNKYER